MAQNVSNFNQWRERKAYQQAPITLGVENTTPVTITQEQLESGLYCLGVQGVGKSTLLESIILDQIANNESVIAIDPHGDLVREIIARMPGQKLQDTYLLDLRDARDWPFGMNLFALPTGQQATQEARDAVRNQVMHAFERIWPAVKEGLYFGNVLRPIIATLIERPALTLADVPRLFYNEAFRVASTQRLDDYEAAQFWEEYPNWSKSRRERYCDPLLDRIKKLLSDSLIRTLLCQPGNTLDLRTAIAQGKSFLLHLPLRDPSYEYSAPIIGTFFMTLLHGAVFSLGTLPYSQRPACTLVIDEFQNFVTEDNEQFFSEGRKYRVKQLLAHQGTQQLDKSGDTSMKKTATSAHTVVCFRTNKDDAPEMAPLFTGIRRRPTSIHIDVLDRMEAHSDSRVKEFYWHTIRPLQLAAKLHVTRATGDQLFFNFGLGTVPFSPSTVSSLLDELNKLFYYAQKYQSLDEGRFQQVWQAYLYLNAAAAYEERIHPASMRKAKILEQKIAYYQQRPSQSVPFDTQRYNQLIASMAALQKQMEQLRTQRDRDYYMSRRRYYHAQRPDSYSLDDSDMYVSSDGFRSAEIQYGLWPRGAMSVDGKLWQVTITAGGRYVARELPEYTRLQQQWKRLDAEKRKMEGDYEGATSRQEREVARIIERLQEERQGIHTTYNVEKRTLSPLRQQWRTVVQALIAHPLAADKAELSVSEIGNTLKDLPNFTAYVKTPSQLHAIVTQDLKKTHPAVSDREAEQRRSRILEHTRATYCRERAVVDADIRAVQVVLEELPQELREGPARVVDALPSSPQRRPASKRVPTREPQPLLPQSILEDDDIIE